MPNKAFTSSLLVRCVCPRAHATRVLVAVQGTKAFAPRPLLSVALLAVKLEDSTRLREDELADRYRPPP